MEALVKEIDKNSDGKVDFDEFIVLMVGQMNQGEESEELKEAFNWIDLEEKGHFTEEELREVMKWYGEELTSEQYAEIDRNGDGMVTFDEFIMMMMAS